jgi:hypothetical protein
VFSIYGSIYFKHGSMSEKHGNLFDGDGSAFDSHARLLERGGSSFDTHGSFFDGGGSSFDDELNWYQSYLCVSSLYFFPTLNRYHFNEFIILNCYLCNN